MSRSDALTAALSIAADRQKSAEEAMAAAQRRHADADATLASLESYCRDYRNRMTGVALTDISMLLNFRGFIAKLELAIDAQRAECVIRRREADESGVVWRETLKKVKSLERLIASRAERVRLVENRRDQKQSDEFATRSTHGRSSII